MAYQTRSSVNPRKPIPTLPTDVIAMILEVSSPQTLINARQVCRSFNILLTERPRIWTTARKSTFGEACPNPPLDLTEFQYATLTYADRCQERGCKNTKATSVCWAIQKRLCKKCFNKRLCMDFQIDRLRDQYPLIDDTILDFCYIKYTYAHYTYTGNTTRPEWAGRMPIHIGYDVKAVTQRVHELDQLPIGERFVATRTMIEEQKVKMAEIRNCEMYFLGFATTARRMC